MIHPHRLKTIYSHNPEHQGEYVLYWMQRSQRVHFNHALVHAIEIANRQQLPLLVFFNLTDRFFGAPLRHYYFMLEGLKEVAIELKKRGINFLMKTGDFGENMLSLSKKAHSVIFDFPYLYEERKWRAKVLDAISSNLVETNIELVESDVIVPVAKAYDKVAYGAYVLRPHLNQKVEEYLDYEGLPILDNQTPLDTGDSLNPEDLTSVLSRLNLDHSIPQVSAIKGGYSEAKKRLASFIEKEYKDYPLRSDPSLEIQSYLSPYLHFGQISSQEIYHHIAKLPPSKSKEEFLEQLLVRRELAFNYVYYNRQYYLFDKMTEPWAYESMKKHQSDERPILYSPTDIEFSKTHDRYFNAAMNEMRTSGFMANYMRMYWAKQIILWSKDYQAAYQTIVYLNNKYFLDGRDPNSYLNIAWIFGKMDRPWPEKVVWGKLRSMTASGLKSKFDIETYFLKWQ